MLVVNGHARGDSREVKDPLASSSRIRSTPPKDSLLRPEDQLFGVEACGRLSGEHGLKEARSSVDLGIRFGAHIGRQWPPGSDNGGERSTSAPSSHQTSGARITPRHPTC
jgi:hypothetical protein